MNFDSTSGISWGISIALHLALVVLLGAWQLKPMITPKMPMLIEVTLSGSNVPFSSQEGNKTEGNVIAPSLQSGENEAEAQQKAVEAWRTQRRMEIIKELSRDRTGKNIGLSVQKVRKTSEGLASGRGAGEWGTPGSPLGTLSFSGEIATRGYREPDFSVLKGMITEETQLRLTLIVLPEGEVKKAVLLETSGFPYVDQKAIELSRKIVFDPLPADWKQVEQQGVLTVKLKL